MPIVNVRETGGSGRLRPQVLDRALMGNTSSSSKAHETRVDQGYLTPHGIYTGPHDWNQHVVGQLIIDRRLAPFYRPLEEYDDSWDDERILANRRGPEGEPEPPAQENHKHPRAHQRPVKEVQKPSEAQIYRGAVECPICFMYYPPNINYSRCCFQAICTECFVQIKRNEPTPTHLVSEPACCPYCQQENFGVTYNPPAWRTGLGTDSAPQRPDIGKSTSNASDSSRRKSLSHDSPNVVTIDQIRPDWEERLAAVKAAVARRANRRIIMRQVGDRLIPVGVTSSRTQLPEGITTVEDIEELMLMEAMRLSLLEQERAQGNSSSTSASAPAQPPRSLLSSSILTPSNRPSSRPSETASDDSSRRPVNPSMAALASPLANASNLIAISTAMPSTARTGASGETQDASNQANPNNLSVATETADNEQRDQRSHQRTKSTPPPTTALAAALSANLTANAFLRPPENHNQDNTDSASTEDSANELIQPGSSQSTSSEPTLSTPPRRKEEQPTLDQPSADASPRKTITPAVDARPVEEEVTPVNH